MLLIPGIGPGKTFGQSDFGIVPQFSTGFLYGKGPVLAIPVRPAAKDRGGYSQRFTNHFTKKRGQVKRPKRKMRNLYLPPHNPGYGLNQILNGDGLIVSDQISLSQGLVLLHGGLEGVAQVIDIQRMIGDSP